MEKSAASQVCTSEGCVSRISSSSIVAPPSLNAFPQRNISRESKTDSENDRYTIEVRTIVESVLSIGEILHTMFATYQLPMLINCYRYRRRDCE